MRVQVIPLMRMPRRCAFFDYAAPEGMTLGPGDLVRIPLRKREFFGIVLAVVSDSANDTDGLRSVGARVAGAYVTEEDLRFYAVLARNLAQSLPSLLHAALPLPPRGKARTPAVRVGGSPLSVRNEEVAPIQDAIRTIAASEAAFVRAPDLRRMAALVAAAAQARPDASLLVIAPHVRDAELLARHLAVLRPELVTGQETPSARHAAWRAWRSVSRVLIGTKVASLLPKPGLYAVFVVRSGHENHKQHGRNPRYDAREAAWLASRHFGAKVVFLDASMRADDLAAFDAASVAELRFDAPTTFVSLVQERTASPHPLISATAVAAMQATLDEGRKVLCLYNRRDTSEYGNAAIRKVLASLFPDQRVGLVDKGRQDDAGALDILLASAYYAENLFDPFDPPPFGLVLDLDLDAPLFHPGVRTSERAFQAMERARGMAHACRAAYLGQSANPELFREYLADPRGVIARELETRRAYGEPPFVRLMRVTYREESQGEASAKLEDLSMRLGEALPGSRVGMVDSPDGKRFLEAAITPPETEAALGLFAALPDRYIIDTDAIS